MKQSADIQIGKANTETDTNQSCTFCCNLYLNDSTLFARDNKYQPRSTNKNMDIELHIDQAKPRSK